MAGRRVFFFRMPSLSFVRSLWITNSIFTLTLMFCGKLRCDALWCDVGSLWLWVWIGAQRSPCSSSPVRSQHARCSQYNHTATTRAWKQELHFAALGIILPPLFIFIVGCSNNSRLGFRLTLCVCVCFFFSFSLSLVCPFWLLPQPLLFIILVVVL